MLAQLFEPTENMKTVLRLGRRSLRHGAAPEPSLQRGAACHHQAMALREPSSTAIIIARRCASSRTSSQ